MGDQLERRLTESRSELDRSHRNLGNVARFCEENYQSAPDKQLALEKTMHYATQALASVAYQINVVSADFIQLLDLQSRDLAKLDSEVGVLDTKVLVHKERIARRHIGQLATNKMAAAAAAAAASAAAAATTPNAAASRQPGVLLHEAAERQLLLQQHQFLRMCRAPINYDALDCVGHGVGVSAAAPAAAAYGTLPAHSTQRMQQLQQQKQQVQQQRNSHYGVSGYQLPSNQQGLPGNQLNAPSNQQYQPSNQHNAPSNQQSAPSYQQYQPSNQQYQPSNQQYQPSNHHNAPSNQHYQPSNQQNAPSNQHSAPSNRQYLPSNQQNLPSNLQRQPGDQYAPSNQTQSNSVHYQPPSNQASLPTTPPPPPAEFDVPSSSIDISNLLPMATDQLTHRRPEDPSWAPAVYLQRVAAIYDYIADKEDELTFTEGQMVFVVKKNDDGWWEGVMANGVSGLFPGNYVE